MNAQERDQLLQFLAALRQQRAEAKDPVADALIRDALAQQADAPYRWVQGALALAMALEAAQARIGQQQAQLEALRAALSGAAAERPMAPLAPLAPLVPLAPLAPSEALASPVTGLAPGASEVPGSGAGPGAAPMVAAAAAHASPWARGLLAQGLGLSMGVATGVVAGGLLLQGLAAALGHVPAGPDRTDAPDLASDPGSLGDLGELGDLGDLGDLGEDWA